MQFILTIIGAAISLALAQPALAQKPPASNDPVCDQSLINLEDVRQGKSPPIGIERDGLRLKASGDYKAPADAAAFQVDAYREFGDVRGYCPKARWPDLAKDATLKKNLDAAVKANPKKFCGDRMLEANVPKMIRGWMNTAGPDFFADRIAELQGALDPLRGVKGQSVERHDHETEWVLAIATELDSVCPNGEMALDIGSAKISASMARDFAKENVAFLQCVEARKAWDPQLKAFDALTASTDPAPMQVAYAALEKAAGPVRETCKASEEGAKENEYILASKRMRIQFLTTPGCRDAAVAMNNVRQSINTATDLKHSGYIAGMRESAKAAAIACKDPAAQTWGEFVAWIAEKNISRIPEKK